MTHVYKCAWLILQPNSSITITKKCLICTAVLSGFLYDWTFCSKNEFYIYDCSKSYKTHRYIPLFYLVLCPQNPKYSILHTICKFNTVIKIQQNTKFQFIAIPALMSNWWWTRSGTLTGLYCMSIIFRYYKYLTE